MQKILLALTFFLSISFSSIAQSSTVIIEGTVEDKDGEPMIAVLVQAVGAKIQVMTDIDGKFRVTIPEECEELEFSYVGTRTVRVQCRNKRFLKVILEDDYQDMGLPSTYYIRGYFSFLGGATYRKDADKWGYLWGVEGALPYTMSERYGTSLYDKVKSYTAIGVDVAKTDVKTDQLQASIYLQASKSFYFETSSRFVAGVGFIPYANLGMYIDAKDGQIESHNMRYGGGLRFSFKIGRVRIPYTNFIMGYTGYKNASHFNHFFLGLRFTPPLQPIYYY